MRYIALTILVSFFMICVTACFIFMQVIEPYLIRKNDIREKSIKNDLYRLYAELDPDIIKQNVDSLIDNAIADYMLLNIHTRESRYMNSQDIDEMIRTVSARTYINLSDMYITFIKMIYNISSDDDLVVFINDTVKMRSIPIVTDNNKLI